MNHKGKQVFIKTLKKHIKLRRLKLCENIIKHGKILQNTKKNLLDF